MTSENEKKLTFRQRTHYAGIKARKNIDCYFYIAPYFLLFTLFTVLPVIIAIYYSFTYYNVVQPPRFIGLKNYIDLFFNDEIFIKAIKNTLIISVLTGPGGYIISLIMAWFINELSPLVRAVLVTVFYAPSLTGSGMMIWSLLFSNDSYGYINAVLLNLGIITSPINFFQNVTYMMPILIIVTLWGSFGTGFLSFVAGFQTIDNSMYEAAYVEGISNRWQELWYITLPSIKPQMMFGAVLSITGALGCGGIGSALFGSPSTDYATHTVMNHLEDYGGVRYEMGYACAIATLLFAVMLGANKLVQRVISKVGT